jgi:predicted Zn-dependent peptidase
VVVGEIDKTDLEQKIGDLLSTVPEGKPFILKKETIAPAQSSFKAEKKELATNYIQGITSAPAPGTADFNAFNLAMRIFSQRHFLEVRTKNGLSYAPGSWFDGGASPSAHISVSTTDPNKYIGVAKALIEKTKKEGFTEDELRNMKTQYLTGFFYRQETNNAQANSLASNEVLHNNWKRALTLSDDMKKVTLTELNTVFNKYISNMVWAYQGNPAQANPALFTGNSKPELPKSKVTTKKKG